jgi:potassium-transporting ATPase KdpC subunit
MRRVGKREGANVKTERTTLTSELRTAALILLAFTALTGVAYPLAITGVAQLIFPSKANGSLILRDGRPVGSELIGQPFDDPKYFWGRPSATAPFPYNAASSSGSNLAVTNPAQLDAIRARVERLRAADPGNSSPIPIDLVTASASGLDPDISVAAAECQIERVARARDMSVEKVRQLVRQNSRSRQFGFLGEPRVNVLNLNLDLDAAGGIQRGNGSK